MTPIQYPKKTIEEIEKDITEISGIAQEEIKTKTRKMELVIPRYLQIFLIKMETKMNHREISGLFGKTDHSKSRYAFKCVNDMIFSNDEKLYALASRLPSYYHKYFFKLSSIVEETLSMPIIKFPSLKVRQW